MADIIKFGTRDRYFSDKNEKRIGRVSFLLRNIFIFIMVALLVMAINMWLFNIVQLRAFLVVPIVIMVGSLLLIFSVPVLVKKRSHDFNNDGKILSYIVLGFLILNFLTNGYTLYILYTDWFMSLLEPNILSQILWYATQWFGIGFLLILLFLLFRPWTPGINNYWEFIG